MGQAPQKIVGVPGGGYRGLDLEGVQQRLKENRYDEATDPEEYSGLMDAYRDSYLGTLYRGITTNTVRGDKPADWDPLSDKYLPKGYEQFASAFAYSTSPAQTQAIKEGIDARLANRERREKRGFGSTLVSDLAAGVLDPSNIVAGPMLKGVGAAKGFFMGGTFAAGVGVAQESIVAKGDPTMSEGEGAVRIGGALVGGFALGGGLGAVVGGVTRKGGAAPVADVAPTAGKARVQLKSKIRVAESSGNDRARPIDPKTGKPRSSATGRYQFTRGTWEGLGGNWKDRYDPGEQERLMDLLIANNERKLAAAGFQADAGNLYLMHFLGEGDGIKALRNPDAPVPAAVQKANPHTRGWTNRQVVAWARKKMGAGSGNTKYALDAPVGPRLVDFGERGYIPVDKGRTGLTDSQGRPVMAAWVREKQPPVDDMTTMPVAERADRFEPLEMVGSRQSPEPVAVEIRVADEAPTAAGAPRPRTRALPDEEAPPLPRGVETEIDAAIELDRLDRGDAEAALRVARGPGREANQPSRFEMKPDGVRAEAGQRIQHRQGAGLKTDVVLGVETRVDGVEVYRVKRGSIEGYVPVSLTRLLPETDNLPFGTGGKLPEADAAFMRDVVAGKGFSKLTQPELDNLNRIIRAIALTDPEGARLWMGKDWDGKVPSKGQVTKRLDDLVAYRNGLNQKAPTYQRDLDGFARDELRDKYDTAIASHVERLDVVDNEIDELMIDMRRDLEDLADNPELAKASRAEYDAALRAQFERRDLLRERLAEIRRNRNQDFGRAVDIDAVDGRLNRLMINPEDVRRPPPDDLVKMKEKDGLWYADRRRMGLPDDMASMTYGTGEILRDIGDLLQKKQELLQRLEGNATTYLGRGEVSVQYSQSQLANKAKLEAEMNDLLNFRYKIQALHDELDDLLPFGVGGKIEGDAGAGGRIKIDVDAILDSYPEKPWRQPIDGVEPLPDALFPTPESWVNFVYFHEREHVLNKRLEGETLGAYETRINNRAVEAMRGENAPWKPVDGWKNELALRPTPVGQLMQLVKNPANYIWESIARLASDYDLRLQRNTVSGGASTPGGSVYQRAMRHSARAADFYNKLEDQYLIYTRGTASDAGPIVRGASVLKNSRGAKKRGKLTFEEFDQEVGKAQASGKASDIPEVNAAAKLFNEIVEDMRRQEDELGLLPGKEKVERELKQLRGNIAEIERAPHTAEGEAILKRWRAKADDLETQLKNDVSKPGKKGLPYFTRLWDVGAMMKDPERIKGIFREAFIREGNDPKTAAVKANEAYEGLIADPTSQSIEVAKTLGEFKSRELPIENDAVIDFIHTDASLILHRYMRRTGAAIEMTRAFGDPSGDLEADRVLAGLAAEGMTPAQQRAAMQIWYDARDRIVGAFHGENPMSMSNRVVRGLKRWTRFAVMGMSGITQFTDFARAAWIVGPKALAKGAFAPLFSQMMAKDPGKYAHAVGEALDFEMGLMSRRAMDDDDWTFRVKENGIERLMGDLEIPFFVLNGVTPLTSMLKRAVARATPHLVLSRARAVAEAVRTGKAVPQEEATWLREHGIDEHDAMLLVDLPVEESKGGFIMADLDAWGALGDKGARGQSLLFGVLSGNIRRSVATPGPLNRPRILDGIMIDKKDQAKAWEDRWVAEAAEEDARAFVIELRKQGMEKGDPDFDAAVDALGAAVGAHTRARLNVGVKGRKERPIRSLPLQLQSFSFAQTGKFVSSVLTGRDKHVLAGFMGMWGAGLVSSWLKGEIARTNENASLDEHLYRGLMATGFLSWMSIPVEGAKGIMRYAIGETRMETPLGEIGITDADRPGLADNAGVAGPTLGLAIGGLEAAFGTGFDGQDLPASDRVYQLRRMMPFGNLLYFNYLMRMGFGALVDEEEGGEAPTQEFKAPDPYSPTMEMLGGFTVGDTDPRASPPEGVASPAEIAELEDMEPSDLIATALAMKKSGRPRRPPIVPLALQFAN